MAAAMSMEVLSWLAMIADCTCTLRTRPQQSGIATIASVASLFLASVLELAPSHSPDIAVAVVVAAVAVGAAAGTGFGGSFQTDSPVVLFFQNFF